MGTLGLGPEHPRVQRGRGQADQVLQRVRQRGRHSHKGQLKIMLSQGCKLETFIVVIFIHFRTFLVFFSSFLQMTSLKMHYLLLIYLYVSFLKMEIVRNEEK